MDRILRSLVLASFAMAIGAAQEWGWYAGDAAATHYSPLAQIDRGNVQRLRVAWEWKTGEQPMQDKGVRPGMFEATPLMIGGVLYLSTPYNRVVALDAATGRERWAFDPKAYDAKDQVLSGVGFVHRGLAAWKDGARLRLFLVSHNRLICLDAATGRPAPSLGREGEINLAAGFTREVNPKHYASTSPPVVYKNLVIVGHAIPDRLIYRNDPPGDVRAFDARSGKQVWTFHTIPQAGEFGNDTWEQESWKTTGHTNVWAPLSLDEKRGLVYLPVSTPSNDFYGGRRPGANLFAESLVCLDAATGKRRWHRQLVHHGLWDYDLPTPPLLVSVNFQGRRRDAAIQLTKMGYVFTFDRVTGEPFWPIEERPVASSNVPGEAAWPTQPAPLRPPPIASQGATLEDAFDLTPELHAEAVAELKKLRLGGLFTPPSFEGTLMRPGIIGGANWGGGAFDPESGRLFVKTTNMPSIARVGKAGDPGAPPRAADMDADYVMEFATNAQFHDGLPLVRPPHGLLTAVDIAKGEIAWQAPFGDTPSVRNHPALRGVKLPPVLGASGVQGGIVTKGGIVFIGGGDSSFHAVDTDTGQDLWQYALGRRTTGTPATYLTAAGQQIVVIASGSGNAATLTAVALAPESATGF
jgi:quinoprotein glucose dehydrogenase